MEYRYLPRIADTKLALALEAMGAVFPDGLNRNRDRFPNGKRRLGCSVRVLEKLTSVVAIQ